jgi:hypothetical protein
VALSCALSNQSYANSGLGWITWRCFGPFQSAYNETTDGEALRWMSSATICATVNGVQTCHPGGLTDTNDKLALTGADLSHLVTTNGACGLGFLEPAANAAMSMSEWSCTNANLSFTHETGHNVGFNHDPKNAGSPPCPEPTNTNCAIYCPSGLACFPGISNFGHAWPIAAPQWRSIMAYPSAGGARITQISNPSILYQGYPTGIPGERDNAKKAVERAPIVAAFRMAVNPPQMPAAPGKPTVH